MRDCTGIEICEEWLYHLGVPEDQIEEMARNSANTIPVMMPFASAYFQPREAGDRPNVVPNGSVNFAFIGNFAETPRDTVFTTEYSIRTAMEAVYTLLGVDRGVPEVWGSVYDVRDLLDSTVALRDGKKITDMSHNCFRYFGGMPREMVFDQDSIVCVSENAGDIVYTYEFEKFRQETKMNIYMCRGADPESKGKIENTVKYIKGNFLSNRLYVDDGILNGSCLEWLARTANAKVHAGCDGRSAQCFH